MKSLFSMTWGSTAFLILFLLSLNTHAGITSSKSCPDLTKASINSAFTMHRRKSMDNSITTILQTILHPCWTRPTKDQPTKSKEPRTREQQDKPDNEDLTTRPIYKDPYPNRRDDLRNFLEINEDGKLVFTADWVDSEGRCKNGINWLMVQPYPLLGFYHECYPGKKKSICR